MNHMKVGGTIGTIVKERINKDTMQSLQELKAWPP